MKSKGKQNYLYYFIGKFITLGQNYLYYFIGNWRCYCLICL